MITGSSLPPASDAWEEHGRRIARSLDDASAALVVGEDAEAAARVALGIAVIQGLHRRVAVGDLVGDVAPLRPNADGDPHGLSDCFLYGVSLNRVGHPLPGASNVFILPSGSEPVAREDVYGHRRWQRLTAGFREVGALLLLVADARTPGLEQLAAVTDGAVAVGTPSLGAIPVLARVRTPLRLDRGLVEASASRNGAPAASAGAGTGGGARGRTLVRGVVAAGFVVAAAGVGTAAVLLWRNGASPPAIASSVADSARGAVASPVASAAVAPPVVPANPHDSARAAAFSVEIVKANTQEGAIAHVREGGAHLSAMTVVPVTLGDGALWYRVLTGAFTTATEAESLLVTLRGSSILSGDPGSVVRAPYALLAVASADTTAARAEVARLRARGLPAYALVQDTGSAHVYIGAFETPDAALLLEGAAREAGIVPVVVFRLGRAF